jgi:hypothetical protein
MVVELCPDIVDYARGGIRTPQNLIATASTVRPMLGISPSACEAARSAMGDGQASVVLAAILATRPSDQESRRLSQDPGPARSNRGLLGLADADGATPDRGARRDSLASSFPEDVS